MKKAQVDHLTFHVQNYEESKKFYNELFELEEKETGFNEGLPWGILGNKDQFFVCLYETNDKDLAERISKSPFKHFGFWVPEFDAFFETIKEREVPYLYDGIVDYPKSRSLYIIDPTGYTIEISDVFGGDL